MLSTAAEAVAVIELATGQRILFRASDAQAVVFESFLPSEQDGLALPAGSEQEQRFEVLTGEVGFAVDGAETFLTAGSRLTVPRGTTCRYWNPGTEASHLVVELRPALEFERYAHSQPMTEEA